MEVPPVLKGLEARYFSYRAILVARVSQISLVLVFLCIRYRTIIARYVAKWGIAQMCLCETISTNGGGIAPLGGSAKLFKKYRAMAMLSQYRAIWVHLRWAKSPIANRQCSVNAVNSRKPFRSSM